MWKAEGNANDSIGTNSGIGQGEMTYEQGKVGQAFGFNGTNSVKISASPSLDIGRDGKLTIECWLKPFDVSVPRPLFDWNNGATYGSHLFIFTDGQLYLDLVDVYGIHHHTTSPESTLVSNAF
jgi:hypothetical protein